MQSPAQTAYFARLSGKKPLRLKDLEEERVEFSYSSARPAVAQVARPEHVRAVAEAFAVRPEMQGPQEPVKASKVDDWREPGTRRVVAGPRPCRAWGKR